MLFYLFAAIAVVTSLLVVTQKHPVHSVMLLIASFGALSGLYVLLDAPFAAAIQIIVYAGAIMVLFLFVVMLLNAGRESEDPGEVERATFAKGAMRIGALIATALGVELVWALTRSGESGSFPGGSISDVRTIGRVLFTDYAFAFEVTSILILVAMVGAVVLARREGYVVVVPLNHYLVLSAVLFTIGAAGIFIRRNVITMLLSIEIMLNAVNLTFVAFGRALGEADGQILVFFVMTLAAAEAAVGLAIVIAMFRLRESLNPELWRGLKW